MHSGLYDDGTRIIQFALLVSIYGPEIEWNIKSPFYSCILMFNDLDLFI